MKIIIPMAGKGRRFDDYLAPKPLIEIEGKPMIEHVVNYYPRFSEFLFLCNKKHLRDAELSRLLNRIAPLKEVIEIDDDNLKGPAHTCLNCFDLINDHEEVIVNYCDFIQVWDYIDFIKKIREKKPDGAIISFKGFHPSSLGDTYYAYMKVNADGFIEEVKEKKSFSEDKMEDFASTGTYYFSSGKLFKKYVNDLVSNQANSVNGEFYMSLPYNLMIKDGLKILNYEVEKFICLGTPRDYELYKFWSEFFLKCSERSISFDNINLNITNIFPLAGGEKDFKNLGFDTLNFMIPIMNKPLIEHSFKTNPKGIKNIFIGLKENGDIFRSLHLFTDSRSEVILLEKKKDTLIETIYEVKYKINLSQPICIAPATNILDYDERRMINLMEQKDVDIILFSFSHHDCILRNPKGLAYAKLKNNIEVAEIVEKDVISENPYLDNALAGTVLFKKAEDLFEAIELELKKPFSERRPYYQGCLNNILHKRKVVIFNIDKFIPIRTPINYKEFIYWQEYFDKAEHHPYSKDN